MNKFTTLIATLTLGALMCSAAIAQEAGPRGNRQQGQGAGAGQRGKAMDKMKEVREKILAQLNLTDKQKEAIKKLDADMEAKRKALMDEIKNGGGEVDREKLRAKMQELQKAQMDGMKQILTPEQQQKFQQLMKEYREKNGGGQPGKGGRGGKGGKGGNGGNGGGTTPPPSF